MSQQLQNIIDQAWENRAEINPRNGAVDFYGLTRATRMASIRAATASAWPWWPKRPKGLKRPSA